VYTNGGTQSDLEPRIMQVQLVYYIIISFIIRWLVTFTTKIRPSLSWFKNNESRLNHHLSGLLGFISLTGHLVHVAIPVSRGVHIGWDNF
jgi:photosystem I P700 chlorophyll a apoprotein A2